NHTAGSAADTPTVVLALGGTPAIVLTWTASDGTAGYNVKSSTTSGGPYSTIETNIPSTGYTDVNVANGTDYYYVVSAFNALGESPNSAEVSGTPTPLNGAPAHGTLTLQTNGSFIYTPASN